jgi:hypothetical protein
VLPPSGNALNSKHFGGQIDGPTSSHSIKNHALYFAAVDQGHFVLCFVVMLFLKFRVDSRSILTIYITVFVNRGRNFGARESV